MIDSETGLPYDWSNPGGGAASTQLAYAPPPPGFNQAPNATPFGQGAGQGGGGMSPLLMQLLGNGVTPGSGMGAQIMQQLLPYLMGMQQQPQQPQFGAPTPDQQSWMSQMGWGNDLNALTPMQRGGLNTALGTTNGPQALANAQYNTPQDFVSQWRQMFGST